MALDHVRKIKIEKEPKHTSCCCVLWVFVIFWQHFIGVQ